MARLRASSTNLRPIVTVSSLGRRRSSSNLNLNININSQLQQPSEIGPEQPLPSMLVLLATRFLASLHIHQKHVQEWSTPSSPRSSTDSSLLPTSQPQQQLSEKLYEPPHSSFHAPIILVVLLFPLSTALVLFCLSTLPISLAWPHNLTDLAQLGRELHGYSQSGPWPVAHVVGVMAISAVWKHAWSIPGSVLWNVLAGALFSPAFATILLTSLTTIGSACATLLSMPLAPFLSSVFPRALDLTRSALGGSADDPSSDQQKQKKSAPWVRLSVLRLIGVVPWSGINIACGVCGVSLADCMLGSFIGSLPWTAVTCQIGDILQTVASTPSPTPQTVSSLLTSPDVALKLIFLSFLSLAPILARDRLRALISPAAPRVVTALGMGVGSIQGRVPEVRIQSFLDEEGPVMSTEASAVSEPRSRWAWVQEWRTMLKLSSSSRTFERERAIRDTHLHLLVQEKRAMELEEILPS